jgi:DNA-binding NarL/FixJ family response regulator
MTQVWIIEDNVAFRRSTARALAARNDLITQEFGRCEDALAMLLTSDVRPDVVLLDIGLPGIDGIEGIVRIKQLAADTGIVVLTVFEDDDKIFRAVCAGASGYLLKSEPMATVLSAIDQAIAGGSPMNPRVAKRVLSMFARIAPAQPDKAPEEDPGLSERERRVLELMVDGLAKKEIAGQLDLNQHTVDYVTRCIYKKLHVNGIAAAISRAMKDGIVKR